ncbi:hypothetical protein CSUB01_11949 [Colletotrichum sublineola]|uniref:Uncharacterized protein n=1 Tax=Colletotrichum sublineola TaxID=1173701 RepID=A0A066XZ73_COLSU|nr:hypothetical protein CSUB01_11949 [Colletotrichum sublineola]
MVAPKSLRKCACPGFSDPGRTRDWQVQTVPTSDKMATNNFYVGVADAELESRYIYTQHETSEEKGNAELESRYIYTQHETSEEKGNAELESRYIYTQPETSEEKGNAELESRYIYTQHETSEKKGNAEPDSQ